MNKMIQEIKESYKKLKYKKAMVVKLASKFNRSYSTCNRFWFSHDWKIPVGYQKQILEIINKQVRFDELEKEKRSEFYKYL